MLTLKEKLEAYSYNIVEYFEIDHFTCISRLTRVLEFFCEAHDIPFEKVYPKKTENKAEEIIKNIF